MNDGLTVAVAFVDFSKAFDSVLHSRLLDKLHGQFAIDGELYAWMDSYLSNQKQFTTINGKESSKMYVRCGVPQGSVLGPSLFTLYTNDLPSFTKSGDTFMYADDTTVFCTGFSQDVACNLLNCALEELFTWCVNNRLTPHPGKCMEMLLSKARFIGPLPAIYIGKSIIEYKATARLLGVTLDRNLSWIPHLEEVIKNFANKLSLLKKSKFLPSRVCESLCVKVIQSSIRRTRCPSGAGLIRQSYLKHWKDKIAVLLELFWLSTGHANS